MAKDHVSKQTRLAFREHFVSWTLATISDEFEAADIRRDEAFSPSCGGARRSLVEQYYHTLDYTSSQDVTKLVRVYESVLRHIDEDLQHPKLYAGGDTTVLQREQLRLTNLLKRDGFEYSEGELRLKIGRHEFAELERHVTEFDLAHIRREIERIKQSVESDPPQAIGTAKELVESCCKTILSERCVEVPKNIELVPLVKLVTKTLKLTPSDVPDSRRGAEITKRLLHQMADIARGLAELRNLYGTGHGKEGRSKAIQPRHARLAAGFATTLAVFLFETHVERGGPLSGSDLGAPPLRTMEATGPSARGGS